MAAYLTKWPPATRHGSIHFSYCTIGQERSGPPTGFPTVAYTTLYSAYRRPKDSLYHAMNRFTPSSTPVAGTYPVSSLRRSVAA